MHVVPKAKLPSAADEEKTAIDPQWPDYEGNATEEGAESLDGLPRRTITGVTNNSLEETVDDQRHQPAIDPLAPLAPVLAPGDARLSITAGRDAGKVFELGARHSYSIGRALENDIVLADIAVSRKHFDLRSDDGAWVVVDHGSGNGTVVNGNLEDHPFVLANGDAIEIGTTTFRFEQEAAPLARVPTPMPDDGDPDDEQSTIAGKPLHPSTFEAEPLPATEAPLELVVRRDPSRSAERPRTLPPPAPRTRTSTRPPPTPFLAATSNHAWSAEPPNSGALPGSTLPMPHMASRAPLPPMPAMLSAEPHGPTLQGQGPSRSPTPGPALFYPQATEIPPHSIHAIMNQRHDGSASGMQPMYSPAPLAAPGLSRRAKLGLGLAGITVFTAVITLALVHSDSTDDTVPAATPVAAVVPAVPAPPAHPPVLPVLPVAPAPPAPKPQVAVATPTPAPPPAPTPHAAPPPKHEHEHEHEHEPAPKPVVARRPDPPAPPAEHVREHEHEPPPTRTAAAGNGPEAARDKADQLYREKHFVEAANVLNAAAHTSDADVARELKLRAQRLGALAKAYNEGMAPGAEPDDAFTALRQASNYDQNLGGLLANEINDKLRTVVPRAAISFLASRDLEHAHTAVIVADQLGLSSNANIRVVRNRLETEAGSIYTQAQAAGLTSSDGKDKLKRIKLIVDPTSQWYRKAIAALGVAG